MQPEHVNVPDHPGQRLARRDFLRWLGIGLAVPATAGLGTATARLLQDPRQDPAGNSDLVADDVAVAFRRAQGLGKALLVAVIPYGRTTEDPADELRAWKEWLGKQDAGADWPAMPMGSELGLRLGRALRYADDETLAAIATTEFVAADAVELKELLEREELPRGELLVVEPDGEVHVAVAALEPLELAGDRERYEQDPKAEAKARALAGRVGEQIRTALFGDEHRLARRLAIHDDRIGAAGMEFVEPDDGSDRDLSRCAPAYLAAAMRIEEPSRRRPWIERLAALGRARYVQGGPVGARWGESDGCGDSYVDGRGPAIGIACGMGFVSPVNSRFLTFRIR